jgi:hypothetical protein
MLFYFLFYADDDLRTFTLLFYVVLFFVFDSVKWDTGFGLGKAFYEINSEEADWESIGFQPAIEEPSNICPSSSFSALMV